MRLAGKTLQFPFLAVTTLSVAAVGVTVPAWISNALASAGHAMTTTAPHRPNANSAIAGYVLSSDSTGRYAYDSADSSSGAVTVTSIDDGVFKVVFAKMGTIAGAAAAQVTAFGDAGNCVTELPVPTGTNGTDLQVIVQCVGVPAGTPDADAEFALAVTRPAHPAHGVFDYSVVTKLSGTLRQHQYNSAGKSNTVKHLGTGEFQVTLGGPESSGTDGIVKVSTLQPSNGNCQLVSWNGSAKGEVVDVDCYHFPHTLVDGQFVVTYATANSLMGISNQVVANAFANGKAAVYQPAVQYDSTQGAKVTIVHYQTGSYEILPAGSAGNVAKFGGDVQVSAVGSQGQFCVDDGWSQQLTPSIEVSCRDKNGNLTDVPFTTTWVVP